MSKKSYKKYKIKKNKKGVAPLISGVAIMAVAILFMIIIINFAIPYFNTLQDLTKYRNNKSNLLLINNTLEDLKGADIDSYKKIFIHPNNKISIDSNNNKIKIVQEIKDHSFYSDFKDNQNYGNLNISKEKNNFIYTLNLENIQLYNNEDLSNNRQQIKFIIVDYNNSTNKPIIGIIRDYKLSLLDSNLVAYWNLSKQNSSGKVIYDISRNNNNGNASNLPVFVEDQKGFKDQAISFNGSDDYIAIDNNLNLGSEFTITTWFKTTINEEIKNIFISSLDSSNRIELRLRNNKLEYRSNSTASWGAYPNINSNQNVNDGKWHNGILTVNSNGKLILYIDGIEDKTKIEESVSGFEPIATRISDNGSRSFDGSISKVKVYNKALSEEEINLLYHTTKHP